MIVLAPYQFSTSSCSDLKAWNKCGTRLVPLCPAFCSAAFCSRGTEWNKPCSAVVPSLQGGTTACAELVWSWNNHLESYLPLVPYAQLITTRNTNRNRNKLMKPLRTTPGSGRLTARSPPRAFTYLVHRDYANCFAIRCSRFAHETCHVRFTCVFHPLRDHASAEQVSANISRVLV